MDGTMDGMGDDIEIIEQEDLWRGHTRLERYRLRHRLFAGGMGAEISREVIDRGEAAAVLPYDPVRDEIVLIRQFRIGAWRRGDVPWLVETVAGLIEDGETPEGVARRESIEETGCKISDLYPVCGYYAAQGLLTEYLHLFVGITDTADAGGIFGVDHEGEDIEAFVVPWAQALEDVDAGRHNDPKVMLAVRWLATRRDELRKQV
jgi:ADP-ribose pyrophosphatase